VDYTEALELQPTAPRYNRRGLAYVGLGQYAEAIADYTQSIDLNTDNNADEVIYLNNRGDAYRNWRQFENAIADYTTTIELDPQPWRYNRRGLAYAGLEQYDAAIVDYTRAIDLNTDNDSDEAIYLTNRAYAYRDLESYEKEIKDLLAAIELVPIAGRYESLGIAYYWLDDFDSTLEQFDTALSMEETAFSYDWRGWIYHLQGDEAKALNEYDRALELAPDDALIILDRAILYADQGDLKTALAEFSRAVELESDLNFAEGVEPHNSPSELKFLVRQYTRMIDHTPDNPVARLMRAAMLAHLGRFEEAADDYRLAIELAPDYVPAYRALGDSLYALDDRAGALKAYEEYLERLNGDDETVQARIEELRG
jgi:tetratricopeptide (TPR) repeat protein